MKSSRWTLDPPGLHPGLAGARPVAEPGAGRAGPDHLPRALRLVQCASARRQDRLPRRHGHPQAVVQAAAALLRRHRPGADTGRAHRRHGRRHPRCALLAGQVPARASRAFDAPRLPLRARVGAADSAEAEGRDQHPRARGAASATGDTPSRSPATGTRRAPRSFPSSPRSSSAPSCAPCCKGARTATSSTCITASRSSAWTATRS